MSSAARRRVLEVVRVRRRWGFAQGLDLLQRSQRALIADAKAHARHGTPLQLNERLLLQEHDPVYTLGRRADLGNVLSPDAQAEVLRVERGGEVTFHGPGQIVCYPVLDLARHTKDLHWFLRQVEQVVINVIASYGLEGSRKEEYTGVWVGDDKVAAIGLNASRWVTSHGFALNVTTDLAAFDKIVPCGIDEEGLGVSSLAALLGADAGDPRLQRDHVQDLIVRECVNVFNFDEALESNHVHSSSSSSSSSSTAA